MTGPLDAILGRIERVTDHGTYHTARCPNHDDRRASLSISLGDDGRVLLKCHAGCPTEAIVAQLGLSMADLFPPRAETVRQNGYGGKIIKTYDYTDENGKLLYQVVRYEPKNFRQRRPDPLHTWVWSLKEVRRVLYRLPELLAAPHDEWILVAEGEKDADNLAKLGFMATTNAGGAGKWLPAYTDALKGRRVCILPDRDDAGDQHAETVARALDRRAAEVRVLRLPGLNLKGDVSDWIAAGGTSDELRRLIDDTPPWSPDQHRPEPAAEAESEAESEPDGPRLVVKSLADVNAKPIDWLWKRWLARGKLHILGGHPGDGKSTLMTSISAALSNGGQWPDDQAAPIGRTLFLLAEDALDDTLKPRLDVHQADAARIFAIEAVKEPDGSDRLCNLDKHLPLLKQEIIAKKIDLLIVDPITSFMPKSDRNSEADVRDLLTPLGKMAERTGVAVVCIMHVGKPNGTNRRPLQQLLGATAFGAVARIVWMTATVPDEQQGEDGAEGTPAPTRRVLGVIKSNIAMTPQPLEWSRAEDGPIVWHGASTRNLEDLLITAAPSTTRPRDVAGIFLFNLLKGGSKTVTEVLAKSGAQGLSEITVRRAKKKLGIVAFKLPSQQDGAWLWRLPRPEDAEDQAEGEDDHPATEDDHFSLERPSDHLPNGSPDSASNTPQIAEKPQNDGKMITLNGSDHLPIPGTHPFEDDHFPYRERSDHLRNVITYKEY